MNVKALASVKHYFSAIHGIKRFNYAGIPFFNKLNLNQSFRFFISIFKYLSKIIVKILLFNKIMGINK